MATALKFPDPFNFSAPNLALEWTQWRCQFNWYILATRKDEKDEEIIVGVLLSLLGREGIKIYDTLGLSAANAKKITPVLDALTTYFQPLKSEVFDRFLFHRRHQQPSEPFDAWLVELLSLVKPCNYGTAAVIESIVRDQIVLGVANEQVREKLLFESGLTLAQACNIVRACESASSQLTQMTTRTDSTVHRLLDSSSKGRPPASQPNKSRHNVGNGQPQIFVNCQGCGRRHKKGQCSAANIECFSCGQMGHFANRCQNPKARNGAAINRQRAPRDTLQHDGRQQPLRPAQRGTFMQQQLHAVEEEDWDNQCQETGGFLADLVNHQLTCSEEKEEEWYEDLSVDGRAVIHFKLDSGATCNVLPYELYSRVCPNGGSLEPGPRVRNYSAKGGYLDVLGVYKGRVVRKGVTYALRFVVVNEPGQPAILGLPACKLMKLIKRVHTVQVTRQPNHPPLVNQFSDVFNGIGKLPMEHEIRLATGAAYVDPVVSAAGRLPFSLEKRVFDKLDQMVALKIIAPVVEPTEWVSRMLVVGKADGDVRICLDPSNLNKAIQRQHFMVPTVEQLFGKIGKAKYFCSLDAASGFYQIPLSERSSYLCTMATPKGRFRFLRLPFGLISAPEVYLQAMSELFGDLPGVLIYFDDFLVMGETKGELECNLRRILELPSLGHVIAQGALKVDPEKVEAIVNMPAPTDKQSLTRLLGMVTYLDKFCKNLSVITRPLRDILKQDAAWVWDDQQEKALDSLKTAISSLPVLKLFDLSKPMVVSVDASPVGIGAVLLQEGQPVAFSSTSLTDTQKRYCQIEKELLAVQFGLLRFKQYVYGQRVLVESDHKPLIGLLDKPIASCSPRIQRMRLQLQQFDFRLTYKPGKDLFIADTLSRAPSPRLFIDDVTQDSEDQVHHVLHSVLSSRSTRQRYADATSSDSTLQLLKSVISKGWPEKRNQCPPPVKPFWAVRNELSAVEGVLLCGNRLVVPMSLRRETMEGIHDGHFGESKSVLRAKSAVYWPGWEDQVKNMVASCAVCQENRCRNPKQPLYPVRLPDYAFQMVSADIFHFNSVNYLLLVDSYSKWPCVVPLKSVTSAALIEEMSRFFCDFGRPEELESDNGTQFASAEFREYCKKINVAQVTSSPEYAQSNGLVERHIQTVKKVLLKMFSDGKSLWEALAAIRSTPVSSSLPAPSVLLQGRNLRGSLPFVSSSLKSTLVPASVVRQELVRRQQRAAFIQPRSVGVRSSALSVGQPVRALIKNKWLPGVVSVVCPEPNSYVVRLSDGRLFRRTRWAINISVCDSKLNPVRPCFPRPPFVDMPSATVPVAGSVIGHPTLAPPSVSRQLSTPTTTGSSGFCARAGQLSVAQRQQNPAPPTGSAPRFPLAAPSVSSCPDPSLPAVRPVRIFNSRIPVADRSVWLPVTSVLPSQVVPVPAIGTTRSGRRYVKPPS